MNQPYNNTDVTTLYRLIGESVWHLQHLENVLSSYTSLRILQRKRGKGCKVTESGAQKSLDGQQKQVLGKLIESAKEQGAIPENMYERFSRFLDERNWVIHKCVVNEYLALRNEEDKNRLFARLGEFGTEAKLLTKEIHDLFESWFTGQGYSIEEAHKNAERILSNAEKS